MVLPYNSVDVECEDRTHEKGPRLGMNTPGITIRFVSDWCYDCRGRVRFWIRKRTRPAIQARIAQVTREIEQLNIEGDRHLLCEIMDQVTEKFKSIEKMTHMLSELARVRSEIIQLMDADRKRRQSIFSKIAGYFWNLQPGGATEIEIVDTFIQCLDTCAAYGPDPPLRPLELQQIEPLFLCVAKSDREKSSIPRYES
jgi:hypothetical protein